MNTSEIQADIIEAIKHWIGLILCLSCIAELIFFFAEENLYGCVTLLYGWFLISKVCIKRTYLELYPLPTLVMFGLAFCYSFLPLIVTLLEGKPLTFNFQLPYLTFTNQIISATVITLAFKWAIKVYKPGCWLNRIWNKIGYMSIPSEKGVWALGFIGLLSLLMIMADQGNEYEYQGTGNALSTIIRFLSAFAMAPICLYFKGLCGETQESPSKRFVKYYIILLMLLGIATTRRMLIFNPIVTIVCIYLYLAIRNNKRIFSTKHALVIIVASYLVVGPLADMAMAMILNRHFEGNAGQTFSHVMEIYNNKELLHESYQAFVMTYDNNGDNSQGWSEYYVNNIFLDRFCNLRVIDATLFNAQRMGFGCIEGLDYYKNFWINELPSSITNALGLVKDFRGTATDHMVTNNFDELVYTLHGFKVGGETGIGLWVFGYWYYLVALVTYFVMFYFLCSFVNIDERGAQFPLPILLDVRLYWMFFLNANGIFTSMAHVFTRANLDTIVIYCIIIFIINMVFPRRS